MRSYIAPPSPETESDGGFLSSSGSLATFAAMRRASPRAETVSGGGLLSFTGHDPNPLARAAVCKNRNRAL